MKNSIYLLLFICSSSLFAQDYERYKKLLDTTISSEHLGFDKNVTITVPFEWQKDVKIIETLEKEITTHYGSPLEFSLGILNGKGWYFYNEKEYEKAIDAWKLMLKSYPNFSEEYLYILYAQIELKQDTSETIEKFHQSLDKKTEIYSETERDELIQEIDSLQEQ